MQGARDAAQPTTISPSEAADVTPHQLQEIAAGAEKADPSMFDKVGAYYAQHPEVFKVLGDAALASALGQMASRVETSRAECVLPQVAEHAIGNQCQIGPEARLSAREDSGSGGAFAACVVRITPLPSPTAKNWPGVQSQSQIRRNQTGARLRRG